MFRKNQAKVAKQKQYVVEKAENATHREQVLRKSVKMRIQMTAQMIP